MALVFTDDDEVSRRFLPETTQPSASSPLAPPPYSASPDRRDGDIQPPQAGASAAGIALRPVPGGLIGRRMRSAG